MNYALLSFLWISTAGLFLNIATGLRLFRIAEPLRLHVVVGVCAGAAAVAAHLWAALYFTGVGRRLGKAVEAWESDVRERIRSRVQETRRKILPGIVAACLVLPAALILGWSLYAGLVSKTAHSMAAYLAVIVHVHVSVRETLALFRQADLIEEVDDLARRKSDSAEISG
ncbi:MAG: hypothetical protein V1798_11160 [Pseudomonadota bacterium]